jgi:YjbE family integral membrane protein
MEFDWASALIAVILIDLALSGDNAIIIGLAVAGLPAAQRNRAIAIGIILATVLRMAFALVAVQLLAIIGLTLAGGILLLWVVWKMWRETRHGHHLREEHAAAALRGEAPPASNTPPKTFRQALIAIVVADASMALDNVLAVAGAAHEHPWVLIVGLLLSIALMGVASAYVARLLERFHWLAYVGILVVGFVAVDMIWRGAHQVGALL